MSIKMLLATAALAGAFTIVVPTPDADARPRGRQVEGTVNTERGTIQGRSEVRREAGQRTRTSTATGPNGRQTSVEDQRQVNREAGTYNHDRTRTFNDGSTRTVDTDAQRTAPGEYTAQRQVTGRDGETRTQTGTFQTERTEDGRSTTGQITTQNYGTVDYNRDVSRSDGVRSVNETATFEDGSQITRQATGQRTEDGVSSSRETTFRDGTTRNVDAEAQRTGQNTGAFTRSVTGRNGETREQSGEVTVTPLPE